MTELAADSSGTVAQISRSDFPAIAWNASPDGLALIGSDGTIIESNEAFDRLVHRDAATVDVSAVFAPDDIRPVLGACNPTSRVAVAGLRDDGYPFVAEVTASRADTDLILLTARARLPSITTQAGVTGQVHEELAHALSHDVRGRLRGVAGFLGMVADQHSAGAGIESAGAELLERAAAAGRAADSMLERLVRYLRLSDMRFDLTPESLDAIVAAATEASGRAQIVSSEPLPVVLADRQLLTEALTEIFRNAIEYARGDQPPVITLSWRQSFGWCELLITDDGPGIAPDLIAESFGLFRQLQTRNWGRGVGMGLPICRRIIDGHGGRVAVRSDNRTGATVSIRLALAPRR